MKLGVIGSGAWGTALAKGFSNNFDSVHMYAIEQDVIDDINTENINKRYLPNVILPNNIHASNKLVDITECNIILLVVPTQHIREIVKKIKQINSKSYMLICSKGLEISTKELISGVIKEELGNKIKLGVLTGPSFAKDLSNGLPTTFTLAMDNIEDAKYLADILKNNYIKNYYTNDVLGSQVGGAIKNVIAIGAGIISGANLGHNALAGFITRSTKEIEKLCIFFGGKRETVYGLSGLGDLILTCTSENSRNFSLGIEIGKNGYYKGVLENNKGIAEGYYTAKAINGLIKEHNLDMPICEEIYKICYENQTVNNAIQKFMSTESKKE